MNLKFTFTNSGSANNFQQLLDENGYTFVRSANNFIFNDIKPKHAALVTKFFFGFSLYGSKIIFKIKDFGTANAIFIYVETPE